MKRQKEEIPEMYLALRKIGHDLPPAEILDPIMVNRAFREQVIATIKRFYTRDQIDRWEGILRLQEEDTKDLKVKEFFDGGWLVYKARRLPWPIRWFGKIRLGIRRKRP